MSASGSKRRNTAWVSSARVRAASGHRLSWAAGLIDAQSATETEKPSAGELPPHEMSLLPLLHRGAYSLAVTFKSVSA